MLVFFFIIFAIQSDLFIDNTSRAAAGLLRFFSLIGGLYFLFIISFSEVVEHIIHEAYILNADIVLILLMATGAVYFLLESFKRNRSFGIYSLALFLLPLLLLMSSELITVIFINLYLFSAGVGIMIYGIMKQRFYYTNVGLLAISTIMLTRFFDTELTFLSRGIIFIVIGSLFLTANIYIGRKKGEIK